MSSPRVGRRDAVIAKVVKMLRLARAAGTEEEAHTALTLAQKLMYAYGVEESELQEPDAVQPIDDVVVDATGHHVGWKEYLAAIIAENFRCAYVISESRATGTVRLVFIGRRSDVVVASEAYQASSMVAAHLGEACAAARPEPERAAARASFLTGFLRGLCGRLDENASATALLVVADRAVLEQASALSNAGEARGSPLATGDADALRDGFASGYAHGSGRRLLGR